jgi:hypothetical protein
MSKLSFSAPWCLHPGSEGLVSESFQRMGTKTGVLQLSYWQYFVPTF